MKLEEVLSLRKLPDKGVFNPDYDDFERLFWKYKGIVKEYERANEFWKSTNENVERSYQALDEKDRELEKAYRMIREDLEVAHRVQNALMPDINNWIIDDLDIAVFNNQLHQIGGDYYDFYHTRENSFAVGVFDISGHGIATALVMSYLKALFNEAVHNHHSPKTIIEKVNMMSYGFLKSIKKYAAFNFSRFSKDSISNVCGGGYGFIMHGNEILNLKKNYNYLGLRPAGFSGEELPFEAGDIFVVYTDGIVDAQNGWNDDFIRTRIAEIVRDNRDLPASELVNRCMETYDVFKKDDFDDITLLIAKKESV